MSLEKISTKTTFYEFYENCKEHQKQNKDCESCKYYSACNMMTVSYPSSWFDDDVVNENVSKATKHLEKVDGMEIKTITCSNCGEFLYLNSYGQEYCHHCGVKLDWSDVKNDKQ